MNNYFTRFFLTMVFSEMAPGITICITDFYRNIINYKNVKRYNLSFHEDTFVVEALIVKFFAPVKMQTKRLPEIRI